MQATKKIMELRTSSWSCIYALSKLMELQIKLLAICKLFKSLLQTLAKMQNEQFVRVSEFEFQLDYR